MPEGWDHLGDLIKHEIEDLMGDFEQGTAMLKVRQARQHLPPALGIMFDHVREEASDLEEFAQAIFVVGLLQGQKGKSLDDYTKCDC